MAFNMELEINEQPQVVKELLEMYIKNDKVMIDLPEKISSITLVASGSSYNASEAFKGLFETQTGIATDVVYSSEFDVRENIDSKKNDLFIFLSQSGETSDTLSCMNKALNLGAKTLCITNTQNSTLWNKCDYKILSKAGEEKSIASTKAVTAQIFCLYLIIAKIQEQNNKNNTKIVSGLKTLPSTIEKFFNIVPQVKETAKKLTEYEHMALTGSEEFFSIAKEGALKIKETSYVNANAYAQGEFMHGHVAVLNAKCGLISIVDSKNADVIIRNLQKIKKDYNNPFIITISGKENIEESTINFKVPNDSAISEMFATLILLQLIAFETAKALGRNVDAPIGLHKVVLA